MNASTRAEEIAEYLGGVRSALADLPEQTRDELLEDLAGHLAEVADEDPTPLTERLGEPAVYAAELRASAGVTGSATRRRVPFRQQLDRLVAVARRADVRFGPMVGYETTHELFDKLRPAWWVLRGYLAALLLCDALLSETVTLVPRVYNSEFVGIVLTLGMIVASVWLGRRSVRFRTWPKRGLVLAGLVLALAGAVHLADVDSDADQVMAMNYYDESPTTDTSEVYPYDAEGRPLTGVRLYDQNGQPLDVGGWDCGDDYGDGYGDGYAPEPSPSRAPSYPRCPNPHFPFPNTWPAPDASGSATPSPDASAGPSGTPSPSDSAASTPSGSPSPSGSASPSAPPKHPSPSHR
ncbi:MAG: hypothetical protein WCA46_02215 [Actinocatenispora sp.]